MGATGLGSGWLDGDAAAYAAQVATGDLADRWTHVGLVAVGIAVRAATGLEPTLALDVVSLLACGATVVFAGMRAGEVAAWGTAAAVVGWASFAEADPLWVALAVGAVHFPFLIAPAVSVSPVALLAVPWMALERRAHARSVLVWAGLAVLALTVVSGGAWWTGERGVLRVESLAPGRTALAWAVHASPLLVLLPGARRRDALPLLGLAGLLVVPPDVPAWVLGSIALSFVAARTGRSAAMVLAVALAVGLLEYDGRVRQVRSDREVVGGIVRLLGDDDGLVAPFTWGARVAVHGTGDPYGLRWHPPGRFLRDQHGSWCDDPPARALVIGDGPPHWTTDTRCDQ